MASSRPEKTADLPQLPRNADVAVALTFDAHAVSAW